MIQNQSIFATPCFKFRNTKKQPLKDKVKIFKKISKISIKFQDRATHSIKDKKGGKINSDRFSHFLNKSTSNVKQKKT